MLWIWISVTCWIWESRFLRESVYRQTTWQNESCSWGAPPGELTCPPGTCSVLGKISLYQQDEPLPVVNGVRPQLPMYFGPCIRAPHLITPFITIVFGPILYILSIHKTQPQVLLLKLNQIVSFQKLPTDAHFTPVPASLLTSLVVSKYLKHMLVQLDYFTRVRGEKKMKPSPSNRLWCQIWNQNYSSSSRYVK